MLHHMKLSTFDLNRARTLHLLLEEAHVGRAAGRLAITPAAASNALRRLREDLGDPLLVKQGRGLVRTRLGEELRGPARAVVEAAERLLRAARPFTPADYRGPLPIAMAEHVAAVLLPALDRLVQARAPHATLAIAAIPVAVADWLERTGGVLVSPSGAFAATEAGDSLLAEPFYDERYVCVMRHGHPSLRRRWDVAAYAAQGHVLVMPRGRTPHSDVDEHLAARGLARRIVRVVPSFSLALGMVAGSDLITTMPERYARHLPLDGVGIRPMPVRLPPLAMKLAVHPAHAADARAGFVKALLREALRAVDRPADRAGAGRSPASRSRARPARRAPSGRTG